MIKILPKVLNKQQTTEIGKLISQGQFVDGKNTAGKYAEKVKQNLQWQCSEHKEHQLNQMLTGYLAANPEFATTCYPKYLAPFIISKSTNNGYYGRHVDDALLVAENVTRSDISCTIFLCDADTYEGGELCFDYHGINLSYKLNTGDAILYPSTTVHEVKPVTKGCRTVAVSWIESYVREANNREVLHDLDQSRQQVLSDIGRGTAFDLISKTHANLLRRWADT